MYRQHDAYRAAECTIVVAVLLPSQLQIPVQSRMHDFKVVNDVPNVLVGGGTVGCGKCEYHLFQTLPR